MDVPRLKRSLRLRATKRTSSQRQKFSIETTKHSSCPSRPMVTEYMLFEKPGTPQLHLWHQPTALPAIEADRNLHLTNNYQDRLLFNPTSPGGTRIWAAHKNLNSHWSESDDPTISSQDLHIEDYVKREHDETITQSRTERNPASPTVSRLSTATEDFDLRPPPQPKETIEIGKLADSLFSTGHLESILQDHQLFVRFATFLNRHLPHATPTLVRYLESKKAIKAVEYANALAESVTRLPGEARRKNKFTAAKLDTMFGDTCRAALETLLEEAFPAYLTSSLVKIATDFIMDEISGNLGPSTAGVVSGLSNSFCITDPHQQDNPIIYASEEFYRVTGYSRDFVLGRNCRILQGPKTSKAAVKRLKIAITTGQEISETLINYRRDGRPFLNTLMVAPLYDNKGKVRYHIGAQVNVSSLIESDRELEGFGRYLTHQENISPTNQPAPPDFSHESVGNSQGKKTALIKLGELSAMLDLEESAVVTQRCRSNPVPLSLDKKRDAGVAEQKYSLAADSIPGDDGKVEQLGNPVLDPLAATPSGKLPGVYQSYLLMRPSPSLTIIFASPVLSQKGKLVQSSFLSHITAPSPTLDRLEESFQLGKPVTAKVLFSHKASDSQVGREFDRRHSDSDVDQRLAGDFGRPCWISVTPLFGNDDRVGVWMVVIVENQSLTSVMSLTASDALRIETSHPGTGGANLNGKINELKKDQSLHDSILERFERQRAELRQKDQATKNSRRDSSPSICESTTTLIPSPPTVHSESLTRKDDIPVRRPVSTSTTRKQTHSFFGSNEETLHILEARNTPFKIKRVSILPNVNETEDVPNSESLETPRNELEQGTSRSLRLLEPEISLSGTPTVQTETQTERSPTKSSQTGPKVEPAEVLQQEPAPSLVAESQPASEQNSMASQGPENAKHRRQTSKLAKFAVISRSKRLSSKSTGGYMDCLRSSSSTSSGRQLSCFTPSSTTMFPHSHSAAPHGTAVFSLNSRGEVLAADVTGSKHDSAELLKLAFTSVDWSAMQPLQTC